MRVPNSEGDPRKYKINNNETTQFKPAKGATHKEKRIGRGEASGNGGTSTKGNKGGQSRAGYKSKMGHEGGQMPIQRRIPNVVLKIPTVLNTKYSTLDRSSIYAEKYGITEFSLENLYINGLISQTDKVKILGNGELKGKVHFQSKCRQRKSKSSY